MFEKLVLTYFNKFFSIFLNVTIRFLGPENMGIGTGIMFLGELDTKLCYKFANLATLYYGSGNHGAHTLLTISNSIPYPRKHGYRHQNHMHMLIRRKVMLEIC